MRAGEADAQAVSAVVEQLVRAWNNGDAAAYAALFTPDADYVTFFGVNLPGRPAIEQAHRALFDGPLHGSQMTLTGAPPTVRFARPDVAIVVATTSVTRPDDTPSPDATGPDATQTLVIVHEPDSWHISTFHNTRRTAPRPAEPNPTTCT